VKAKRFDNSAVSEQQQHSLCASIVSRLDRDSADIPFSAGLCVPRGRLRELSGFKVLTGTSELLAQAQVLNRWSDGSVRWVLASFVLPSLAGVSSSRQSAGSTLQTGQALLPLQFLPQSSILSDHSSDLMASRCFDGEIVVQTRSFAGQLPDEHSIRLRPVLLLPDGEVAEFLCDGITEETSGPVCRTILFSLRLRSRTSIQLTVRITHWLSVGLWQVEPRLRNTERARHDGGLWDLGDSGSFLFSGLQMQVRSDDQPHQNTLSWRLEPHQAVSSALLTEQVCVPDRPLLTLCQHGSGGPHWNSTNHLAADGESVVQQQGYTAACLSTQYSGLRAEPLVALSTSESSMALSVPDFWQNFPSSLTVTSGQISVGLFAELPVGGERRVFHELQGGEQKTRSFWVSLRSAPFDAKSLEWTTDRPALIQSADAVREAGVFHWFPGTVTGTPDLFETDTVTNTNTAVTSQETTSRKHPRHDDLLRLKNYLQEATSGEYSLQNRRDSIDEYGWRNFGDMPADHEQTHFQGSGRIISHYNNQFDMVYGGILQLAASADLKWRDLYEPLARHVMDIDIYHTAQDRAVFNGGLFWHTDHYVDAHTSTHRTYSCLNQQPGRSCGGGPGCEHNYTTGLLSYYFLTGHPEARDSVLSLAEWVIQMDDGRQTIFGLLDDGPTGHASSTVWEDFHGPGRGPGNSVNALLDAWTLCGDSRFIEKAEELICRCVHPKQDLTALHLSDAEGHWSYTVFLTSLSRYLQLKLEVDQRDAMYAYAREVMAHYGRWMALHEQPALNSPETLEYPTEAWAAQEFRKANALRLAALCEDDDRMASLMRSRARALNNQAWDDLYAFGNAHLTARCLSILMTEGQRDLYHRTTLADTLPPAMSSGPETHCRETEWQMFVPQKMRVRKLIRTPSRLIPALLRALQPRRLWSAWNALRRQL
jgi:hypothetical protein